MKKAFLLSIALVLAGPGSFAQWEWQNPLPQGNPLNSVCFPTTTTGYAAGELGTILKTTDGGATWTVLSSGTTLPLNAVYFTDASMGFAVGGKYNGGELNITTVIILKTTDGGGNWTSVFMSSNIYFSSVFFTEANTGYAVGYGMTPVFGGIKYGIIYKTIDGGITWNIQYSGPWNSYYSSVYFFESETGYVVGSDGTILITNDAGATWNAQSSGFTSTLNSVYFTNANTGIVLSNDGIIMKTVDGGATWNWVWDGNTQHTPLKSVCFTDANTGYVVGGWQFWEEGTPARENIILKTIDGGTTWAVLTSGTLDPLYSVYFTGSETGYAVGDAGTVLKTNDEGISWNAFSSIRTSKINSIFFADANTGYAAGSDIGGYGGTGNSGALLKTADGGATWNALPIEPGLELYSVCFTGTLTGYAVGNGINGGTILKTIDGGESWTSFSNSQWWHLFYIDFVNANTGYIVGNDYREHGIIIKTTDGGTTWTELQIETINILSSVSFTDASTGYIVGGEYGQIILKTIDGGVSWTDLTSGTLQLNSVYFADFNTGYAAGVEGIIMKTVDGGLTWATLLSGTTIDFNSIYFTDANTGFVVGNNGAILKTTDGGITWTDIYSGTINSLFAVYFTDANTGYVAGEGGTILKTTNGGGTVGISEKPVVSRQSSVVSNYPNPARTFTMLEYSLEESAVVTLKIYNQVGQEVAVPVNEQQASGDHQEKWNAEGMPAGVYFYTLKAGKQAHSGKIIVME